MINSISSMGNYMGGMNIQAMQHRRDDLFTKIDTNSDGGLDKTEFSALAKRLSGDTENSINVDTVYSTYDKNGDGSLSKDELDSFMKDNAPHPPDMSGGINGMTMRRHEDDLFAKIDSDSDGGLSKAEFSAFAEKLSEDTGDSIDANTVYSTYDKNGDGSLSKEELDSFMNDNAPPPPQMQQAISAYGMNTGTDQTSSLLDLLNSLSSNGSSTSSGSTTDSSKDFLSTLLSNLSSMLSSGNISSLLSVQA